MTRTDKWQDRFDEKFVETYGDGSDWGVGLRIKSDGTTKDRETLENIKQFISQVQQDTEKKIRKEYESTGEYISRNVKED